MLLITKRLCLISGPRFVIILNMDEALTVTARLRRIPHLMGAAPLAELLGVAPRTVYALARREAIPHIHVGASVRFDPEQVARWLTEGGAV